MTEKDFDEIKMLSQWEAIKRFDHYIDTANTKAGIVLTLNFALFAGVLDTLSEPLPDSPVGAGTLIGLIILLTFAITISSIHAVRAIWPDMGKKETSSAPSVFFFHSVATCFDAHSYTHAIFTKRREQLLADLCKQTHELASITNRKMEILKLSKQASFVSIIIVFCILLVISLCK